MMKRIIALLLALILTVGLLPTVALATEGDTPVAGTSSDVKNGYYEGTTWKEGTLNQGTLPTGVESVSKTAKPTSNPNEYEVELKVVLKQTKSQEKPGAAATVLVLDHSGSMNGCADCNSSKRNGVYYHTKSCKYNGKVTTNQTRMYAATQAVLSFIKTYSGRFDKNGQETTIADLNLGRWVCLVWFNETGGVTGGGTWVDVSNKSGYQSATNTSGWSAHDGTNLDCGLRLADYQLKQKAEISKNLKNVVVLSDGKPTYYLTDDGGWFEKKDITIGNKDYYVRGDGGSCDEDTYNTTKSTAATLRNSASVYTVCFGASGNEIKDYDKNGNQKITVGNYLKQKIATQPKSGSNEKFAYDAADADALNTAFAAISKTIVSGLSTGTVKDTLPTGISSTVFGEGKTVMNWELNSDAFNKTEETKPLADGTKETVYTYTKTYTVTINPDDKNLVMTEDGYAPLNGETTLTVKNSQGTDVEIPFPIPAGKVTPTKITTPIVVKIKGGTDTKTYNGTEYTVSGYEVESITPDNLGYTANDFTFTGTASASGTNAGKYQMNLDASQFRNTNTKYTDVTFEVEDGWLEIKPIDLTITAKDNTVPYDGNAHGENGYNVTGTLATGETITSVTISGSKTEPGTYTDELEPSSAVIKKDNDGTVVPSTNYNITYVKGTLTITADSTEKVLTIKGHQSEVTYDGDSHTVSGYDVTYPTGTTAADFTITLKNNKTATATGTNVKTDGGKYMMDLTAKDFDVKSSKYSNVKVNYTEDGWLKINPRAITLTSGSNTKNYDGTALTKNEVTVTSGNFVSGEGLDYKVTGSQTEVGTSKNTYTYAAKAGTTLTNYTITEEEGDLTVTLPDLTARPNVIVNCVNTEVPAHTEKNTSLTNADHYTVSTEATKVDGQSAYTRTITLTEAGKNHFISSEYVPEYGSHTPATNGNVTEITMTYSEVNGEWAWRASHANFLLNVECTTPTVEVDLGNYIKKTLTGTNFHENFSAEFKVDVAYSCDGNKTATGSVTLTGAAVNKPFNFDKITLKQGFYYIFAVTEREANVSGVTCDTTTHEFALNVKTDGNVEFGSVVDKQFVPAGAEADQFLTITNTYTEPTYAVEKSVINDDASDNIPDSLDRDIYQYPTNGKFIVEKTYTDDTITFLYVIEVSGKNGAEMTIQEKDGGKFISVDYSTETRATINPNAAQDTYTVKLTADVDASDPIKLYAEKTFHKDADGKFPTTATNALLVNGKDGPKDNTTIEERGTLTVDFGALVHKHLTVTGDKSFNGATFTVNFTEGLYAPLAVNNSIEVYADAGVGKEKLPDLTASVTYTADERNRGLKDFDGADLTINTEGNYSYIVSEQIPAGATGYDTKKYVVGIVVVPDGDGLKVEHVWYHELVEDLATHPEIIPGGPTFYNTIDTGKDDYYPIIIPTIINKDTGMLNKTDHFAYVIGYPDGTVHPNGQITRAEVATIFFRLLRDEVRDGAFTTSNTYSDVAYGKWYNNPISTMSALGIITGYPDGTFKPNKPITRAEFAAIAARFDETQSGKSATFSDVIGHWAAKEIGIAYYNDWIKGYPDGTFKPDQNITRAEAMTLINRVLERKPESPADLLTNMNKWTDNMDTSKWYYLDVQEATNSHGYTRKTFNYELWRQMLPDPDWSRYER